MGARFFYLRMFSCKFIEKMNLKLNIGIISILARCIFLNGRTETKNSFRQIYRGQKYGLTNQNCPPYQESRQKKRNRKEEIFAIDTNFLSFDFLNKIIQERNLKLQTSIKLSPTTINKS